MFVQCEYYTQNISHGFFNFLRKISVKTEGISFSLRAGNHGNKEN